MARLTMVLFYADLSVMLAGFALMAVGGFSDSRRTVILGLRFIYWGGLALPVWATGLLIVSWLIR